MIRDYVERYFLQENCNCAESVLLAANEALGLGLTEEDCKLVSAFGGGMGCGSSCGALCGAMAILGKVRVKDRAHTTEGFKDDCAALAAAFEKALGAMDCKTLKERHYKEDVRCLQTVMLAADVLEQHLAGMQALPPLTAEQLRAVKGQGFLHNKGTRCFNGRIITRNGKITSAENACIAEAAQRFGSGEVALTSRLTIEIPGIVYENIEPFRAFLAQAGLETGGTGSKVRPVVSCKGTTCQYGQCDTFSLSRKIHDAFYTGYHTVLLPHKFKIAVGGCPNNCVKPDLNDVGVAGLRVPCLDLDQCKGCNRCAVVNICPMHACKVENGKLVIDQSVCNNCGRCVGKCHFGAMEQGHNGFRVYIGGRWGKKVAQGRALEHVFTSEAEVMAVVEKAILLFRDQGITGERFSDTIERLGFENVQAQLLTDDLLQRKEEIIGEQKHLVGGATC